MKKNIVISVVALCTVVVSFVVGLSMSQGESAVNQAAYPEEAQSWINSIISTSRSWEAHDAKITLLNSEVSREVAARNTDAVTAQGLRQSLCNKYKLSVDGDGGVVECLSFQ